MAIPKQNDGGYVPMIKLKYISLKLPLNTYM